MDNESASEWQGPEFKLYVEISEGKIFATGTYENFGASALGPIRLLGLTPFKTTLQKEQCKVTYEGEMKGRTFKGSLSKSWGKFSGDTVLSSDERIEETEVLMVISETLTEISVYEKKNDKIYCFTRDTPTETEPLGS